VCPVLTHLFENPPVKQIHACIPCDSKGSNQAVCRFFVPAKVRQTGLLHTTFSKPHIQPDAFLKYLFSLPL
jgi:hypothetical protein